jgi:hypothetical protein
MKLTDEATLVEAITGHDPRQLEGWNTVSIAELAVFHREQFAQYATLLAAVERALTFHQTTHIHATLRAALSASGAGVESEAIRLLREVYQTHRTPTDAEYEAEPCAWCRAVAPILAGVNVPPPPETKI